MNCSKAKEKRETRKISSSVKHKNIIRVIEPEIRENHVKKLIKKVKEKERGKNCFMGEGIEKWQGPDPQGPLMAEIKKRATGSINENRFDLLSIYFQIKLFEKEMTC